MRKWVNVLHTCSLPSLWVVGGDRRLSSVGHWILVPLVLTLWRLLQLAGLNQSWTLGKWDWTELSHKFTGWPSVFPFSSPGRGNEGIKRVLWDLLISEMLSLFLDMMVRLRELANSMTHFLFHPSPPKFQPLPGWAAEAMKVPSSPTLIFSWEMQPASSVPPIAASRTAKFYFPMILKSSAWASWVETRSGRARVWHRSCGSCLLFASAWLAQAALVLASYYGEWPLRSLGERHNYITGAVTLKEMKT